MSSQSGATQSSLILTMKFLKLIQEDGAPTLLLQALVKQADGDAKKEYAELINKSCGFVSLPLLDAVRAAGFEVNPVLLALHLRPD
jgi:hypothetical protein